MKRAEIEKLFDGKLAEGIDTKEIVDAIMKMNGEDVNAAKDSAKVANEEGLEKLKKEAAEEALKPYMQGGEKYIDVDAYQKALEENKAYKEKEVKLARDSAVGKMLADGKFDSKVTELLRKVVNDYEPKWTEDNELENAQEIIEKMQSKYPDFVIKETQGGFSPATPVKSAGNEEQDAFIAGFLGK